MNADFDNLLRSLHHGSLKMQEATKESTRCSVTTTILRLDIRAVLQCAYSKVRLVHIACTIISRNIKCLGN